MSVRAIFRQLQPPPRVGKDCKLSLNRRFLRSLRGEVGGEPSSQTSIVVPMLGDLPVLYSEHVEPERLISTRFYAALASSSRDTALATSVTPKTTSDMFDPGSVPQ